MMKMIFGDVEFKNPLTPCDVAMIYKLTGCQFDVGETEIKFEDDYFHIDEVCDWLDNKEIVFGWIKDYGDFEYGFFYDEHKKEWYEECKNYLVDHDDEELIRELERRGYKIEKVR